MAKGKSSRAKDSGRLRFESFVQALAPVADKLKEIIDAQKHTEEERTSRETLRAIQHAFREAMLTLPAEEYDWFDINVRQWSK